MLVKGTTSKETIVTDTNDENGVATTIEQQVTVAHLLFLHSDGKLEHYQSRGDTEKEFGDAIVHGPQCLLRRFRPTMRLLLTVELANDYRKTSLGYGRPRS